MESGRERKRERSGLLHLLSSILVFTCGKRIQVRVQRFIRRGPPDLLVVMEGADDGGGGEEDGKVGAAQVSEQALSEVRKRRLLRRQKLDGGAVVAALQEPGVDARVSQGGGHPGGGAEV